MTGSLSDQQFSEQTYQNIFNDVCQQVQWRQQHEPSFNIDRLREMLDAQYKHLGNDWTGRGLAGNLPIEATIAAYEHCLAEWEKQLGIQPGG